MLTLMAILVILIVSCSEQVTATVVPACSAAQIKDIKAAGELIFPNFTRRSLSDEEISEESEEEETPSIVGGDEDDRGCIGSAGYTWCESLNECVRLFKTECPVTLLETPAETSEALIVAEPGPVIIQPSSASDEEEVSEFEKIVEEITEEIGEIFGEEETTIEIEEEVEEEEEEKDEEEEEEEEEEATESGTSDEDATEEIDEAHQEAIDEWMMGISCADIDASYILLLAEADAQRCEFCGVASDADIEEANAMLSYLDCDLRLCDEPEATVKSECTADDLEAISECQMDAMGGHDQEQLNDNPHACDVIKKADACIDDSDCDACKYAEFYARGYVQETNLKAIAEHCPDRLCGETQGGLSWKEAATSSIHDQAAIEDEEGEEEEEEEMEDAASILGTSVFVACLFSVALVIIVSRKRRDTRERQSHTFLADVSELEMTNATEMPQMDCEKDDGKNNYVI
ncbi:hypothetical protein TrST_g6565 [Triparma strigata]|uniref:Uncharacterized protein n=1 Tax=Triparma strigata TaxID=1606541 RepID=A0A9W7EEZ4_9STRA|nr:hypothetical protein TrST_g6565 [Triparma strigata]